MANANGPNFSTLCYESPMVTGQAVAFNQQPSQTYSFTSESPFFPASTPPNPFSSPQSSIPSSPLNTPTLFYTSSPSSGHPSTSTAASPILSPFSQATSIDSSGFASGSSFNSPVFASPVPANRIQLYKNHQYVKESPANQLKLRRDSIVAKFRRIDLDEAAMGKGDGEDSNESDDDDYYACLPQPDYDPAWSFTAVCDAQEWDDANAMDAMDDMEW